MSCRLYEGKEHASSYWKYRIAPSDHLIQQVLNFLEKQVVEIGILFVFGFITHVKNRDLFPLSLDNSKTNITGISYNMQRIFGRWINRLSWQWMLVAAQVRAHCCWPNILPPWWEQMLVLRSWKWLRSTPKSRTSLTGEHGPNRLFL